MKKLYTILFLLILFLPFIKGQESTPPNELIYGVYLHEHPDSNSYHAEELGFNTIVQYVHPDNGNQTGVLRFDNSIVLNGRAANEYILHYSAGYYKKWEAEENIDVINEGLISGVKHLFGEVQDISGRDCWVVSEEDEPGEKFIYGPHYAQDKKYRHNYMASDTLYYKLNFRIKSLEQSEAVPVCSLKVIYKYKIGQTSYEEQLEAVQVNSSQLSTTNFTDISLTYHYPAEFHLNQTERKYLDNEADYLDTDEGTGIQFIVDWLGGPRIAVDYIEVYDEAIWGVYIVDAEAVITNIVDYANSLPDLTNHRYWHSQDAPLSIDGYEPYRVIDAILDSINAEPLITDFHPYWNGEMNGRKTIEMWKNLAQPRQLYLEYLPMWYEHTPNPNDSIDWLFGDLLRGRFQEAHFAIQDFYFLAPVMDFKFGPYQPLYYRQPAGSELRAMLMLALSHGSKGIFYMHYYSYNSDSSNIWYLRCNGLVDTNFVPSPLWEFIKDNISPRITGTLGNTLAKLKYTGSFIDTLNLGTQSDQFNIPSGYLTLFDYNPPYHWHIGFLEDKVNTDNKYFLITNLRTGNNRTAEIAISNNTTYYNLGIRDVENNPNSINTTISQESAIFYPQVDSGDGYLIQVAPVVKYGGTLAYEDTIKTGTINLIDNMTIEDGVDLVLESDYVAKDTITLEGTGFITGDGYFYLEEDGEILINNWSRSLFKSRQGNYSKMIWGEYPTSDSIVGYKVYREKQVTGYNLIAIVTGREYIDSLTIIVTGGEQQNETWAKYKVKGLLYDAEKEETIESSFSNIVDYNRVQGNPPSKQKAGEYEEVFTYSLETNYPNPYNPETIINYSIAEPTEVRLSVFDILGREIKVLVNDKKEPGNYEVSFDASSLSSGIYIYRIETKNFTKSQKMVLIK